MSCVNQCNPDCNFNCIPANHSDTCVDDHFRSFCPPCCTKCCSTPECNDNCYPSEASCYSCCPAETICCSTSNCNPGSACATPNCGLPCQSLSSNCRPATDGRRYKRYDILKHFIRCAGKKSFNGNQLKFNLYILLREEEMLLNCARPSEL